MRAVLLEAHSNPMVASSIVVLSGVRDETAASNGASHFLEHLLFDGTRSRTQDEISKEADFLGGYNNASTRDEYTLFQFLVHRDHLEQALDIQADMLFRSVLTRESFEKERKVVLEEMARDESEPSYAADQFFRQRYYAGDPRAMPVLGTTASIRAMTREAVAAHYLRNFKPERMVLLLAGDFDRDAALAVLEHTVGAPRGVDEQGLKAGGAPDGGAGKGSASPPGTGGSSEREPNSTGKANGARTGSSASAGTGRGRSATARAAVSSRVVGSKSSTHPSRRPANSSTAARTGRLRSARAIKPGLYRQHIEAGRGYLGLGIPAPGIGDPDVGAMRAIAAVLGDGPGSRVMRALAGRGEALASEASASFAPGGGEGVLEIDATLPPDSDGAAAVRVIRGELLRLAREPITQDELRGIVTEARAKTLYLRDQVHYLGMAAAPDLALGPRPSLGDAGASLEALTPAVVQAAAERWLRAEPVVTISSPSVPAGTNASAAAPLPAPAPASASGDQGDDADGGGAAGGRSASSAGSSERHGADPRRDVRRIDFENGLVLLVAENPDSEIFAAHVLVRDRAAMEPEGREGIADYLHRTLLYGSLYLDSEGLQQKLRTLGAKLKTVDDPGIPYDDYYTSPRYSYLRFETLRENWREGMGLLFTTVAYPRLEQKDLAIALSEEIDLARRSQESPSAIARGLYARTILAGSPMAHPVAGSAVSLAQVKPDDLRTFHAKYFSPDQLILSVVSNVPATDVIALVRQTFGALPQAQGAPRMTPVKPGEARKRVSLLADPPITESAMHEEAKTGKEQSQILMGRIFAREAQDLAPLIVATTVLSQSISRELRETRGLAYSVGCTVEDFGGRAWFTASMGTRPENVEDAEAAIRAAIAKFSESAVAAPEVQRAVNAMRGQIAMRRMTRISQAYALGFNELLGRDVTFDAQLDAALAKVTADDIRRVARQYLDTTKMVTAVAR